MQPKGGRQSLKLSHVLGLLLNHRFAGHLKSSKACEIKAALEESKLTLHDGQPRNICKHHFLQTRHLLMLLRHMIKPNGHQGT